MRTPPSTQLQTLHAHLTDIDNDLAVIAKPIDDLNSLLGDVIDLLGKPKKVSDELKTIGEVLSQIQSVCRDASWLPEVGQAAGAMSKALLPIVEKPPPGGLIGQIRTGLNEIDVVLSPLQKHLQEARKPVKQVHDAIHAVELDVRKLVNGTQGLIRRYGAQPPENVERCAARINRGIEKAADELRQARETIVKQLARFLTPLGAVESAFHRVEGYFSSIESVFRELDTYTKALREITNAVDTAAAYGKKKIEDLFSWIGRHTYPDLYRKIKDKLDDANRFVNQLMGRVARMALAPVKRAIDQLEGTIKKEVSRIPEVQALEDAMASAYKTLERLEDDVADALGGECAKVLGA